jgi:drug/metabolite transporter (DMT)-like permease
VLEDFLYGQLIGVLYLIGKLTLTLAYAFGPGGPVNTLSTSQSIVQTLMDSLIMGQSLGAWGISGLCLGVFGTFVISMGNSIWRYIFGATEKVSADVVWSPKGRLG